MWALTGGNALYLRHLVDGEREAGRLRELGGVWRWSGQAQLSQGLRQLVAVRIGELSDSLRDAVDLLALGEPLEVTVLERLTSRSAVEEAEERGLAAVELNGRRLHVRLAHPLYGEARRAAVGVLRARRLRGRLATALSDTGAHRSDDVLRKALLLLDSDLKQDPQLLTAAARSASQLGDLLLAERLARAAVNESGGFDSRLQLAYTLTWLDRGADADQELMILEDLAGDDTQRSLAALPRAENLFFILRRPQEAQTVLARTAQRVSDEISRLTLASMQAAFQVWLGQPRDAVRTAREPLAHTALPDESVILATWGLVAGLGVLGRFEEARPHLPRGYDAVARIGDGPHLGLGLRDLHILALRLAGHVHEAEALARAEYEDHRDGFGVSQVMRATLLGHTALARGKVRTSIRWLREARAGFVENDDQGGWGFRCLMSLTQALALAGETTAARQALTELETYRHPGFVLYEPEVVLAKAWVAAAEGAVSKAVRLLRTSAEINRQQGQVAWEVQALHTAVRLGDRSASVRLAQLSGRVDGPRAPAAADHGAAFAARDGDALRAASDRLAETGDLLAAADAAAQAAAEYTRIDQRVSAMAAAAQAKRLAEEAEGARTPALIAIDRPLPLTDREREVITLAVHGQSNQQIADRLGVSIRTVEGHLYRASARLGVSGRAELAAVLHGG
ncbi:helix-turn-helix transcriptional regulator [Frankia gtarii]|uniref:helix-turn-helix transcriptional regulator n=1 Tax=Frankia gtarii TaxID=2950102 RepID=UPI0021C027D1|nr:LuxR family transcriptional regulator [Frankia gtarii]